MYIKQIMTWMRLITLNVHIYVLKTMHIDRQRLFRGWATDPRPPPTVHLTSNHTTDVYQQAWESAGWLVAPIWALVYCFLCVYALFNVPIGALVYRYFCAYTLPKHVWKQVCHVFVCGCRESDFGNYSCRAVNSLGRAQTFSLISG